MTVYTMPVLVSAELTVLAEQQAVQPTQQEQDDQSILAFLTERQRRNR